MKAMTREEQHEEEVLLHREQHVAKLVEICEDLDKSSRGYVKTSVLANILKGIPGARAEIRGSSL